jgi:hypothetical protein
MIGGYIWALTQVIQKHLPVNLLNYSAVTALSVKRKTSKNSKPRFPEERGARSK